MVAIIIWFFLNPCSKQLTFETNHSFISCNNSLLPLFSGIHFIPNLLLYKAGPKLAKSSLSPCRQSGGDMWMWSGGICLRWAARNSSTLICEEVVWINAVKGHKAFKIISELCCPNENGGFSGIKTKYLGSEFTFPQKEKRTGKVVGSRILSPQRLACFEGWLPLSAWTVRGSAWLLRGPPGLAHLISNSQLRFKWHNSEYLILTRERIVLLS